MDTVAGPFTIWDWQKYRDYPNYCTGQDDVSMTLDLYGSWEASDWTRARDYVTGRSPGWVYDFGAHIGWYAVMFARAGHHVYAVDADPANCELLAVNARNHKVGHLIKIECAWVSDVWVPTRDVVFIKSDVEGHENDVVEVCANSIYHRKVGAMLLECSPEFADYYPSLIAELEHVGYSSDPTLGATQANIWFE